MARMTTKKESIPDLDKAFISFGIYLLNIVQ